MATDTSKKITLTGDTADVDATRPYTVVERRPDGAIVLAPADRSTQLVMPEPGARERLRELSGSIRSGGELGVTVRELRDEWPF